MASSLDPSRDDWIRKHVARFFAVPTEDGDV